jgi:hypothetical protein
MPSMLTDVKKSTNNMIISLDHSDRLTGNRVRKITAWIGDIANVTDITPGLMVDMGELPLINLIVGIISGWQSW